MEIYRSVAGADEDEGDGEADDEVGRDDFFIDFFGRAIGLLKSLQSKRRKNEYTS